MKKSSFEVLVWFLVLLALGQTLLGNAGIGSPEGISSLANLGSAVMNMEAKTK